MADPSTSKLLPVKTNLSTLSVSDTRKTITFAYGFIVTFIAATLLIIFYPSAYYSPSSSSSSPWLLRNIFNLRNSFLSSNGSHFFPNSSSSDFDSNTHLPISQNPPFSSVNNVSALVLKSNLTQMVSSPSVAKLGTVVVNGTVKNSPFESQSSSISKRNDTVVRIEKEGNELYESMLQCNVFDGKWVRDESYPLYAPGSCPHIDVPFNCFLNGRPDNDYVRYRWQPNGCNIPRLNATHMLELLRGKRLVFVGDSLNRNMWESLVCILTNSVKDKNMVFEASGRHEFRTEGSYSFIFIDYNCSVEFFRSPFLVQEWEVPDKNGLRKETLRLDLVERQSDKYKDADVLIFNTGHWWTHDKTSKGQGYYQEGNHVYSELNVLEAFRRAVTTWARWVDANVDPTKTQVFFRGYSSSHFRGGRWNSGGRCDKETEPFKNDTYLLSYPPKMQVLENVIKCMKTPVFYLNITRLSDYRKDAHPAVYRAQQLTEEERRSPLRYQDCSHWCLPGVPDTWNELIYVQILIRTYQTQHDQQNQEVKNTSKGHRG